MNPCGPGLKIVTSLTDLTNVEMAIPGPARRRHREDVEHHELHLGGLDLLAQVLGRAPDHEPGDEHREEREDSMPFRPTPTPPGLTSPSFMWISGIMPPSGV